MITIGNKIKDGEFNFNCSDYDNFKIFSKKKRTGRYWKTEKERTWRLKCKQAELFKKLLKETEEKYKLQEKERVLQVKELQRKNQ